MCMMKLIDSEYFQLSLKEYSVTNKLFSLNVLKEKTALKLDVGTCILILKSVYCKTFALIITDVVNIGFFFN